MLVLTIFFFVLLTLYVVLGNSSNHINSLEKSETKSHSTETLASSMTTKPFSEDDDWLTTRYDSGITEIDNTIPLHHDFTSASADPFPGINPATGLPMMSTGGIDVAGNPFGTDLSSSVFDDSLTSSAFSNDFDMSDSFSSFDDPFSNSFDDSFGSSFNNDW